MKTKFPISHFPFPVSHFIFHISYFIFRISFHLLLLLTPVAAFSQGVGINTTTPKSMLDVEGNVAIGATYSGTTAAPANGIIIEGNVGIGTSAPQGPLEVRASPSSAAIYISTTGASDSKIIFQDGTTDEWAILRLESNNSMRISEDGVGAHFTILPGGNVGIGTTAPEKILHVQDNGASLLERTDAASNNTELGALFLRRTYSAGAGADGLGVVLRFDGETETDGTVHELADIRAAFEDATAGSEDGYMAFWSTEAGTLNERVRIAANGNVGIGTDNPGNKVHIYSTTDASHELNVENTNATGLNAVSILRAHADAAEHALVAHGSARTLTRFGITLGGYNELLSFNGNGMVIGELGNSPMIFGTNNTERIRITGGGQVGIGSTSPYSLFDLAGSLTNNVANARGALIQPSISSDQNGVGGLTLGPVVIPTANMNVSFGVIHTPALTGSSSPTSFYGSFIRPSFAAGFSGTVTNLHNLRINDAIISGGTATEQKGLAIADLTSGGTNWAIYTEGTTQSYFGGNVGIGSVNPTRELDVAGAIHLTGSIRIPNGSTGLGIFEEPSLSGALKVGGIHVGGAYSGSDPIDGEVISNGVSIFIKPNGSTSTTFWQTGGVTIGSPTGGDQGAGTLNAVAVYDDGTILTDYVFDQYFDGEIKPEDKQVPENYSIMPIDEWVKFMEKEHHLPTMIGREEWNKNGKASLGKLTGQLWETIEWQALYIKELKELNDAQQKQLEDQKKINEDIYKELKKLKKSRK